MSRILLADHSPHAQRMGERILRDEGHEVASVTDGETALLRLKDLTPDLILADISLPGRNGYDVCEYVKTSGKYPQTRVVLTAGAVAAYDDARAQAAQSDGFIRKPFEASVLLDTIQPLIEKPDQIAKAPLAKAAGPAPAPPAPKPVDREQVRAAVILAVEASLINIIENLTDKVMVAMELDMPKIAAAAAQPAARPAETKTEPAPAPEEPVVRIRTPVFRTLS
jgi:CheY-like chemotaxis protein